MPEPQWLDRDLVDELHDQSLQVHGGLCGIRDVNVLEAAIASPRNLFAYGGEDNLFCLAAHLLVSLAKAHPYSDGNKRIAIISAVAFLGCNGIELNIKPGELVPQTIRAARCKERERETEEDAISLWLQLSARRTDAANSRS
ncbi:death-on-curing family protein [Synechococcus sp. RS9909]|uniref:type II toxin-antitoxin system death-on-curing family toxin n=1 Tax=unclassified Synechococcus TaxID=2626047 RepID=UPI0000690C82|nr:MULTISPECIES: type II toxin-antitoxin system death-on-curing family toxin [unclassified Synechococcus]EAQ67959.1 death on curing protein [Synechococcus sp. RS9917]QNI79217.1 death-on-curing family protein [Synechococcus sp. RS9909]